MAWHQYDDIQIDSLGAGKRQEELIKGEPLVRRLLGRVAYEVFRDDPRMLPGKSLFRLQGDAFDGGEDETLVGMHYFANGNVDTTMHTVSPRPRDLEDREFIGLDDVSDVDEFLSLAASEVAECSYVLESESEDQPDVVVEDVNDISALEGLIAADHEDSKQSAS